MEYPAFVYRKADKARQDGSKFDTLLVHNDDERKSALDVGWADDVLQALAPKQKSVVVDEPVSVLEDEAPPTRAELESKATELGLKFDGRTSDRKLGLMIAEALGE
jgi:hypothetical protein